MVWTFQPNIATGGVQYTCPACANGEEEELDGSTADDAHDDFLKFPGRINRKRISPMIDTGGGCNLINEDWVKNNDEFGSVNHDPQRSQSLLMADGSTSKSLPIIDAKWKFDDRDGTWKNVEFIVVPDYHYDALLGLPFLKRTETIHSSQGKLVFPEFKGKHVKKEAIPIYDTRKAAATGKK
jgi:hypothetical protein